MQVNLAPDRQMSHHALPSELDLHLVVNSELKVYEDGLERDGKYR